MNTENENSLKESKTGKYLWDDIEELARNINDVGDSYVLTLVDFCHPPKFGEAKYRLSLIDGDQEIWGKVIFGMLGDNNE